MIIKRLHQMDKTIIGLLSQEEELGYYTYAQSLTAVPVSLFSVVSTVFMPRLTNMTECHKEKEAKALLQTMYRIHVFVGVGAFWGILGIADIFTVLFLEERFEGSAVLMKYLAASIPVIGISNVIGNGYLLPLKKDKIWILSLGDGWAVLIVACLTGSVLYILICMLPVLYEKGREEGGSRNWRKK